MARKKDDKSMTDKITELEFLFGKQETAKRLGISPTTLRNYKTGKTKPKKAKQKKLNFVYGQNKKKVDEEAFEKYREKVKEKEEKKKRKPKLANAAKWIRSKFDEPFIVENLLQEATEFVAITDGETAQFVSVDDIARNNYGRKKTTKYVHLFGLYITQYLSGGSWVNKDHEEASTEKAELTISKFPIGLRKEDDLQGTLDYLEAAFLRKVIPKGRIRWLPYKFIGYRL